MPLYEYQCQDCHSRIEVIQRAGDRRLKKCPKCGGTLEKTISAPALQFKGKGWYITDYSQKKPIEPDSPQKLQKKETKTNKSESSSESG